jgi:formate dehydrogenase iron-sulfur subunit
MYLNRRNFIKSLTAIALIPVFLNPEILKNSLYAASLLNPTNNPNVILFDSSKCTGCLACEIACRDWNHIPAEQDSWTLIKPIENITRDGTNQLFGKYQCMHCKDAACVKVCPTGALINHPAGFIAYDINKCSGCGYCVQFCPFKVPYMVGNTVTGIQLMNKCTFCEDRLSAGKQPACVEACPVNALTFGNRTDILSMSKERLALLKNNYPGVNLYGEKELNGLQVMYIILEPPDIYELPGNPEIPASIVVWKDLIQPLGFITAGLLIIGLGFNYLISRATLKDKDTTENK